ncbi:MAG: hypothetical protein WCQ99_05825 [Pseudomonadota bacterium]
MTWKEKHKAGCSSILSGERTPASASREKKAGEGSSSLFDCARSIVLMQVCTTGVSLEPLLIFSAAGHIVKYENDTTNRPI